MEPKTALLAAALLMVEMEPKTAFSGGSIKPLRKSTYSCGKNRHRMEISPPLKSSLFCSGVGAVAKPKYFPLIKKKKRRRIWGREKNVC